MQENVNAVDILEIVTEKFGSENVKLLPDGAVKLKINYLYDAELESIVNMSQYAHVEIRRSDKRILVLFTPRETPQVQIGKAPRIRDFYENLPQEARMKAFDNTAKNDWDKPVKDLQEAILTSFYIGQSPEGADYWQHLILKEAGLIV